MLDCTLYSIVADDAYVTALFEVFYLSSIVWIKSTKNDANILPE